MYLHRQKIRLWDSDYTFTHPPFFSFHQQHFILYLPTKPLHHTHQAVKLRYRALVSWVTNVPDLDASLPSCVNVSGGITDSNSAHHLSMVQCVDLTGMAWDPWADQSIWGERHWLHLPVSRHVKRVGPDDTKGWHKKWEEMKKEVGSQRKKCVFSKDKAFLGHCHSSNIQAATNTLTVCRREFLSDWEAFQELAYEDEDQNQPWGEHRHFMITVQTHAHGHWQYAHTGQY